MIISKTKFLGTWNFAENPLISHLSFFLESSTSGPGEMISKHEENISFVKIDSSGITLFV